MEGIAEDRLKTSAQPNDLAWTMITVHGDRIGLKGLVPNSIARPSQGLSPVKDPVIARFAEACGATAPLDLRVDLIDGGRRAEGSVAMPLALVGRDDACDVTLTDPEVNPRHAWLQVVGGRVLAVDLGSRAGLEWPGQGKGSGWLDVGVPVRIGQFQLRLCSPVSANPISFPPTYSPLQSDSSVSNTGTTTLEFRNGRRAKDRWTVNRLITLVGRAPECKIRLNAEDISGYHCGLVLTPSGLWVVDLSGRGVVINGERMRVSPLANSAELWVGRFLIGIHSRVPATSRPRAESVTSKEALTRTQALTTTTVADPAEDEVQVGTVPARDPQDGLPSSHILADAFQLWASVAAGSLSNPVLISESDPPPTPSPSDAATAAMVVELLRELGEVHGQMLNQFKQSLSLMVRLFACLGREQLPTMQQELSRIHELNSELALLQAELARRAADQPKTQRPQPRVAPSTSTPTPMPESTVLHDWVADRIGTLQRERQARWQSLVGMFAKPVATTQ